MVVHAERSNRFSGAIDVALVLGSGDGMRDECCFMKIVFDADITGKCGVPFRHVGLVHQEVSADGINGDRILRGEKTRAEAAIKGRH